MESIEQTSSHPKRKLGPNDDREHFYSFDIEHDQNTKSFCCRSPTSNNNLHKNMYNNSLTNYQQTTKIIQEFNIQQSTTSDITVSSTINIKSTPKAQLKNSSNDLLSEADFQRVVQDITPADRDLFDEFLNGIKQKTDDYLFLSTFDDLPSSSSTSIVQEHDSISKRHSSLSLPSQTSSTSSSDRRRNSMPRGSSTIHYGPHSMPISNRPSTVAAQTLKQMAVQHQQRIMYNQQQTTTPLSSSYSNYPYNNNNNNNNSTTRQYYQQPQTSSESDTSIDPNSYYQPMCYPPVQSGTVSSYNHHAQQRSNIYGIQNYSYQTSSSSSSSSFYQQQPAQTQQISTSSHPMTNYSPSNGLPTTASTFPFYSQEDNLPILDL